MAIPSILRLFVLTLLLVGPGRMTFGAEDLPTPATAPATSVQYKRAGDQFYAHGDVLRADPDAVILPLTAFAQNGDIYTYTPRKKAPKIVYAEVPNDWIEPITPPDMPASLNIAPDVMQIREPHGDVEVAMPNAPTTFAPAADGQPLPNGAVVKTGAASTAAILFGGVDSARLMPNSEAAAQQAVASTSRAAEVDLTAGGVFSKVGTQAGVQSDYQVHTPNGTALAQGGDFATLITAGHVDIWVAQGTVELLQPDGKKFGTATGDGTGPLKLIRYPAIDNPDESMEADSKSLTTILNFIPMADQKLAALHSKAAAGVPLTANEQAYMQRIKQVPALIKLALIIPPPATIHVLADGKTIFESATLNVDQLRGVLTAYVPIAIQPSVEVKADPGATYADFQAVLAACKATTGLKYEVVGETPPPPPAPPKPLDVIVHSDGTIMLNGAAMQIDEFTAKIKAAVAATPDVPVTVHPDPKLSYVALAAIIDACKNAPAKNFNVVFPPLKELTVAAHGDGSITFHDATMNLDEFSADIKAAVALRPGLPIVVHSNPKMDYAKFTAVVDACKATGAKEVTLVQPTPQPPPPPTLDVVVQADGTIKFQDTVMPLDVFTAKIKDAVAATPDAPVTVHPDPKAVYVSLAAVVNAISGSGAKNLKVLFPSIKELSVAVHGDGSILFHGAKLNLDEFTQEIKAAVALQPNLPIVVHSNPKMDYGKFEAVVDACKATGAKEVTLVQPTPQPAPPPAPAVVTTPATQPAPKPVASQEPLTVIAHGDGSIKFQGKTMKIDEFTTAIKAAAAENSALVVIIHSNPKMDYAKFEAVVDACKNAPAKEVDVVPPAPQPPAPAPAVAATPAIPAAPPKPPEPATVLVHEDGTVGFLGKRGTLDEFKTKLAAMVQATPTRELVIKTSGSNVTYDHVKAVLDACAAANVAHVTAPPPPASLPVAAETPPASKPAPAPVNTKAVPAEIDLAADGTLKLDGATVTEDDLKTKLADIKATNPKNPLVMMKQPGVTKEQWMHFVDLCHSMGLRLLVKNAKAPALAPIAVTPPTLRPSAAEGGSTVQTPPTPAPHLSAAPAPEETTPASSATGTLSSSEEAVPVEIELTPDGQVSFLGEAVSDADLKARLASVAQSNAKEPVLIVKDEKVSHDQLQHVVDLCHAAKLKVKVKTVKSSDMGALKLRAHLPVALEPPPAAGVSAPSASDSEKVLPVEIGLASRGRLTFEGLPVTLDDLKARLATVAKGDPDQPVVIMKEADVPDDSVDALVTVCQGVSSQLKISVKTAPSFTPPSLPDNSPADNLPATDVHLHAAMDTRNVEAVGTTNP